MNQSNLDRTRQSHPVRSAIDPGSARTSTRSRKSQNANRRSANVGQLIRTVAQKGAAAYARGSMPNWAPTVLPRRRVGQNDALFQTLNGC